MAMTILGARSDNMRYVKQHGCGVARRAVQPCRGARGWAGKGIFTFFTLLLGLALAASPAAGQGAMSMSFYSDGDFTPTLARGDLDVFVRVLKLKDAEVQAMHDLYDGYAETVRRESGLVRDKMYDVMEESEVVLDPRKLEPAQKAMTDWRAHAEELKRTFVDDLKALLTKEQEQRWPIVERELRRMKLVGGRLTGESLDVVRMVSGLKLPSTPPAADQALEVYSQELDRLLVQREKFMADNSAKFGDLIKSDPHAAEVMFRDALRIRVALRELNERTVKLVAAELPADAAAKLMENLAKQTGERVNMPSRAEGQLKSARELDGLTTKQVAELDELAEWYASKLKPWKERLAVAVREDEERDIPIELGRALGKEPAQGPEDSYDMWRLPVDHPIVKIRQERSEFDKELRRRLGNILTRDQRDSLPTGRESYVTFYSYRPSGL